MADDINAISTGAELRTLSSGAKLRAGRYEIRDVLGQGNFGITYQAWDALIERMVAVKEYLPNDLSWGHSASRDRNDNLHLLSSHRVFQRGLESFLKEIRSLAKFNHPNVVRIFDLFKANGTAYMVMGYEPWENLEAFLGHNRRLPEKKILEIIFPMLDGLEMVHKEGILHRDIKPSNILVRPDGSPCLLDFGTAREVISKRQLPLSLPNYSPPERFDENGKQGPWTDIYALGAVCYRIIAGHQPAAAIDRLTAVRMRQPDPLLPAQEVGKGRYRSGILKAIDCALRIEQAQRPQNALEWRGMVVPIGVESHVSEPKEPRNGGFLGKLKHLFRSPDQAPSGSVPESAPTMEAISGSAAVDVATEPRSLSLADAETKPVQGIDHLCDEPPSRLEVNQHPLEVASTTDPVSDEPAEPTSLPEESSAPSEAEKVAAPAPNKVAEPPSSTGSARAVSIPEQRESPQGDVLPRPASVEPTVEMPKPRSTNPLSRPPSDAAPLRVEPATERSAGTQTPEKGVGPTTKTGDGLDTLFEDSRQPSTRKSAGISEPPPGRDLPPDENGLAQLFETSQQPSTRKSDGIPEFPSLPQTPPQEKDWSSLFESQAQSRPIGDVFSIMPPSFEDSPLRLAPKEPKEPKVPVESAVSPIAAYNDRALQLFRNQDYAGALAELEAAKALEPDNPILMANIKRVKQRLQGPTEWEGDPWTTS
jgi:serine/threonine protein kinase